MEGRECDSSCAVSSLPSPWNLSNVTLLRTILAAMVNLVTRSKHSTDLSRSRTASLKNSLPVSSAEWEAEEEWNRLRVKRVHGRSGNAALHYKPRLSLVLCSQLRCFSMILKSGGRVSLIPRPSISYHCLSPLSLSMASLHHLLLFSSMLYHRFSRRTKWSATDLSTSWNHQSRASM